MSLFSEAEKKDIQEAVRAAEAHTAGELVIVLAERSDDYAPIRGTWALVLSFVVTELLRFAPIDDGWLLPLFALGVIPFYFLLGVGPLLRLVVPTRIKSARVLERALRAFTEEGVTETHDRSGVLILLSEAEHQVVILADRGIHERVEAGEWEKDVQTLTSGLRQKRAAESLLEVIRRIGGLLESAFPAGEENQNELPDAIRER